MLGEHLGRESPGMQVKLYSPHPFPWRQPTGGLRDEFGVDAWAFFEQHSDRPFYRFETLLGRRILRYATADLMRAECINCHNTHPDTPKDDWRTGDVRGVLEIALPIDGIEAETRDELHSTFALIGAMSLLGLSGLSNDQARDYERSRHGFCCYFCSRVRIIDSRALSFAGI